MLLKSLKSILPYFLLFTSTSVDAFINDNAQLEQNLYEVNFVSVNLTRKRLPNFGNFIWFDNLFTND